MTLLSSPAHHVHPIRVYYEDTDFSGAVYHASYLRFLERGRTEFLRALDVHQAEVHAAQGFGFVVRAMAIDYLRPAQMDDLLTIETRVVQLKAASIDMLQRVLRDETVLVTASVRVACVIAGRAARMPAPVREKLLAASPAASA